MFEMLRPVSVPLILRSQLPVSALYVETYFAIPLGNQIQPLRLLTGLKDHLA